MSTATLIPAGGLSETTVAESFQAKRRSLIDPSTVIDEMTEAHFPRTPSSDRMPTRQQQENNSGAHNNSNSRILGGGGGGVDALNSTNQMILATAPHDCEAKHLHLAAEKINQLLQEV